MFGLGIVEIIVIVLVVLLAVKPEDLPKFIKKIGKSYNELKNTVNDVKKMKDEFVNLANEDIKKVTDITAIDNDSNETAVKNK